MEKEIKELKNLTIQGERLRIRKKILDYFIKRGSQAKLDYKEIDAIIKEREDENETTNK